MRDKLLIWGTIFLILGILVVPTVYVLFSLWWLLTGDMVTRLTFFTTSFISTFSATIVMLGTPLIEKLKKLFKL